MNERTHFFIKIYLSQHFILERVDVGYEWEVSWRQGQTATYWPKVLLTIAALLSHSGCAAQPWVTEGRRPPVCKLILTLASCPQLNPTAIDSNSKWPKPSVAPGYIIVCRPPASSGRTHLPQPRPQVEVIFRYLRPDAPVSLFFRLFTQVHLLIDGLVEGQYATPLTRYIFSNRRYHINSRATSNTQRFIFQKTNNLSIFHAELKKK